jgi:hypothetical protein
MMLDVIEGIGQGYLTTYTYDCLAPIVLKQSKTEKLMNLNNLCHSQPEKPWMPVFQINRPADMRTNPYTG